ncbi:hypothetical protein RHMOL_Rhmol09G0016500 [Rhododendron molle]|uniref:Uncharacterized protein n=1 Tax=Rhododendron molle TaxID=49168 RepID=A0ACC0M8W7_RHOML|nr:hypothetical protein RHMOL_Rhmol09G0016500 [Rhododendron molle]
MVCAAPCSQHLQAIGSCIRRLRSHFDNEQLSIIDCRDEIRAVGCMIQRLEGAQHDMRHLTLKHQPQRTVVKSAIFRCLARPDPRGEYPFFILFFFFFPFRISFKAH